MKKLIIAIICIIALDGSVQSQTFMNEMHWDTLKVSQSRTKVFYEDDSTIVFIVNYSKFNPPQPNYNGRAQLFKVHHDFFKYNTVDRYFDWYFEYTHNPELGFEESPDHKLILYDKQIVNYDSLFVVDAQSFVKTHIKLPDSLRVKHCTWNPVQNCILIEGYMEDPNAEAANRNPLNLRDSDGPLVYLYFPELYSLNLIYRDTVDFFNKNNPGSDIIWHENGKSAFIDYGNSYDNDVNREYIIKYDMETGLIDTIYDGELIDGWMIGWHHANDTSILFMTEKKENFGWTTWINFYNFNPQTGEFKRLWYWDTKTQPGFTRLAMISFDRRYVAYYSNDYFAIDDISGDSPILVHKHSIDTDLRNMDMSFSPDSKKICYIRSYWRDSTVVDNKYFYYGNVEFVYGTIK